MNMLYLHIVCICNHTLHLLVRILFHYKIGIDPTDSYIYPVVQYMCLYLPNWLARQLCVFKKMSKSWYGIMVIKPKIDDKLVMSVFMNSTIHMFAWKDREMPIRIVNCAKIWITGSVLCSYVLNLCIFLATNFLLWKVAYIGASSYEMIWEPLCKARHLGWTSVMFFYSHHTERLNLLHDATNHWSTGSPVPQVYDLITDIM